MNILTNHNLWFKTSQVPKKSSGSSRLFHLFHSKCNRRATEIELVLIDTEENMKVTVFLSKIAKNNKCTIHIAISEQKI